MKYLKFIIVLLVNCSIVYLYWILYDKPEIGVDDANIYFVYAKNFINENGFVYNSGGEKVEGFTSIIWLLIISLIYKFFDNYELILTGFTTLLISYIFYRCIQLIDYINNEKKILSGKSIVFLGLILLVPGYIDWTVLTIMETGLWSFLIILISVIFSEAILSEDFKKSKWKLAVLLPLLLLTRPESILWVPVFIALVFVFNLNIAKSLKSSLRLITPLLIIAVITIVSITILRLYYFGYPLPNTYYAKVSSNTLYNIYQGIRYFLRACIKLPHLFVMSIFVVYAAIILLNNIWKDYFLFSKIRLTKFQLVQLFLSLVSITSLIIPILTGGDHFHLARFFQPYYPIYLMIVLNTQFWNKEFDFRISYRFKGYNYLFILIVLLFAYIIPKVPLHDYVDIKSPIYHEFELAELGRSNGNKLNALFNEESKPSIGVSAAGGFAYSYQGETIDLMGLNNTLMAHAIEDKKGIKNHAAFDISTFFELKPDILHGYKNLSYFVSVDSIPPLLEDSGHKSFTFVNNMYKGLFDEPEFINAYFPVFISNNDLCYTTYAHREYIEFLKSKGYKITIRSSKKRAELNAPNY